MAKMRLRKKATPAFNPFNPKDRAKVEGKIFSDEWVKHNAWMGDENEKSMTKTEKLKKHLDDLGYKGAHRNRHRLKMMAKMRQGHSIAKAHKAIMDEGDH